MFKNLLNLFTKKTNDGDDGGDDFDFDDDAGDSFIDSRDSNDSYIARHIARIPQHGDDSLWRIASAVDLFDGLDPAGTLTPDQKRCVLLYVENFKQLPERNLEKCSIEDCYQFDFPECQYIANGLEVATAKKLGNTYRAGKSIPQIDNILADRISNRLNQMQNRRTALRK
jgi:hypothetical protein